MAVRPNTGELFKGFTFDGVDSKTYGVYITQEAAFDAAERDVEMISIAGRNGEYALDRGRFLNVTVTYKAGITATDEALPKLREIQGVTIDEKTVAITADDKTQPEFREVEGIKLKGKKVTVTADTQEALQALQGIEGVTVDTKTVKVTAETDEARQKVEELKRLNILDCMECGSCAFTCPGKLPLVETFRKGKVLLRAALAERKAKEGAK